LSILYEFFRFIRARKKYWVVPVLLVIAIVGVAVVFGESSVVAPFIYALF